VYNGKRIHPYFLSKTDYHLEMTRWIKENLPPDARIGIFNAGYIGYFSGRKVINLDGLINGIELYQYLKDGKGVWKYVLDKNIDYIADYSYGPPDPMIKGAKSHLKLVHRVGKTHIMRRGSPTYVDGYIWKVEKENRTDKGCQ
jgi:hypothetical protein